MTFQGIVCDWCRQYKRMRHNPAKNKRFYLVDTWDDVRSWGKDIAPTLSPCVVMESGVEGSMEGGKMYRDYPVYFCVRARKMADGEAAAEAKEEAFVHAAKFLMWLLQKHNDDAPNGDYGRINMEDTIPIGTAGPLQDGWYGVLVQLSRLELMNLCVDEDLYMGESED